MLWFRAVWVLDGQPNLRFRGLGRVLGGWGGLQVWG